MAWRISQVQPDLDDHEVAAVADTVRSGWLTEGPHAEEFVAAIQAQTGARHAVLAPNGTLGLFLALLALDLPRDSEILIPSFTFFASASAAVFAGLRPVFVDADPIPSISTSSCWNHCSPTRPAPSCRSGSTGTHRRWTASWTSRSDTIWRYSRTPRSATESPSEAAMPAPGARPG